MRNNPDYLYNEIIQNNSAESLKKLETLAQKGNSEAAYLYALVHYNENSIVSFDADKAFYWATKAAQEKHGWAQNLLAVLHENGEGTEKNYEKAAYWFNESVKNNIPESEIGLFRCYEQGGYGIEQDICKAFQHLKNHALRTEDVNSTFEVALRYFNGTGVKENKDEAFRWFKKVANTERVGAYHDDDVDTEAIWVQTMPEEAVVNSYYNLAICYQNGYGTPINEESARHWMDKYDAAIRDNEEYAKLDEQGRRKFHLEKMKQY